MAYPNSAPSTEMSGYWGNGAYTPTNVVGYIKDDVTPINKNAMVNSVGKQLSLIQNFVNSTYLGRSGIYVQDGYISGLHAASLIARLPLGYISQHSDIYPSGASSVSLGSESLRYLSGYFDKLDSTNISGYQYTVNSYLDAPKSSPSSWGSFIIRAWAGVYINGSLFPTGGSAFGGNLLGSNAYKWEAGHVDTMTMLTGYMDDLFSSSTDHITLQDHIRPSGNNVYDLGVVSQNFRNAYINNIYTRALISTSSTEIIIHNHLTPISSGLYELGAVSIPFQKIHSDQFFMATAPTSYLGSTLKARLWVDPSGYVRRGDFPNFGA